MRTAYFTICSANYLAYARALHASLRRAGVTAPFHCFLVDEIAGRFDPAELGFPCIETRTLGIAHHFDMAARYTVMEMNTAVKPFCIAWLFDEQDAEGVVYLDPDITVLRPLDHVQALLEGGANAVLTPHGTAPLDDGRDPDDLRILRTGTFNLGFGAFRRSAETRAFLGWWGRQLEARCIVDLDAGLFVDQKFMDLAPSYLEGTAILRHPGYNVAYWNLLHRPVIREAGDVGWLAAGQPLHFFHFSGVAPGDRSIFSRHQDRFEVEDIGELRGLLESYLDELDAFGSMGAVRFGQLAYRYNHLANGLPFTPDMREVFAATFRPGPRSYEECFGPDLNTYLTLAPQVMQEAEAPITRLLHSIWQRRKDLREAFPLHSAESRRRLVEWYAQTGAQEQKVPAPILAVARRSLAPPDEAEPRRPPGLGIYGYFRSESGLGSAVRGNWRAAQAARIPSRAFPLPTAMFEDRTDAAIPLSIGPSPYDCLLLHVNADTLLSIESLIEPARLEGRYRIGYWVWELGHFPEEWRRAFNKIDEVWAPSAFAAAAFARATLKPVRIVPHPVPLPALPAEDPAGLRRRFGIPADRFAFLAAFDLNSFIARKNPMAAVRAFQAAFPQDGPSSPILVVKCHGKPGKDPAFRALLAAFAADPRIHLLDTVLSPADVGALQSCCDAFLSLHRSEGFGLWVAECMAWGKPVIATNYGGTADFARAGNSLPIGYSLVPVEPGAYPFGAGQWWAEPDHDEAVAALRAVAADAGLRQALGAAARDSIGRELSEAAVGHRIADRLAEIRLRVA